MNPLNALRRAMRPSRTDGKLHIQPVTSGLYIVTNGWICATVHRNDVQKMLPPRAWRVAADTIQALEPGESVVIEYHKRRKAWDIATGAFDLQQLFDSDRAIIAHTVRTGDTWDDGMHQEFRGGAIFSDGTVRFAIPADANLTVGDTLYVREPRYGRQPGAGEFVTLHGDSPSGHPLAVSATVLP